MFNLTKRSVVKTVARITVRHTCGQLTVTAVDAIRDNDETDTSNETVDSVAYFGGYITGSLLLDQHVNNGIDRVANWRAARKEKKNSETPLTETK